MMAVKSALHIANAKLLRPMKIIVDYSNRERENNIPFEAQQILMPEAVEVISSIFKVRTLILSLCAIFTAHIPIFYFPNI